MSETEISQTPEGRPPEPPGGAAALALRQRRSQRPRPKPKIGDTRPALRSRPPRQGGGAGRAAAPRPARPRCPAGGDGHRRSPRPRPADDCRRRAPASGRAAGAAPGRDRKSKQVGRYLVCVHVQPDMTQIAMLEGRSLVEHYVSRAADDTNQIDGNVYRGRVQNVLPGHGGRVHRHRDPQERRPLPGRRALRPGGHRGRRASQQPRIEDVLKAGQTILCQVTKNPIGAKGARLTQEVSLPGPVRRPGAQLERLRHLQAAGRQRAPPAAPHHRRGEAGWSRHDRAHGRRGGLGRGAPARRRRRCSSSGTPLRPRPSGRTPRACSTGSPSCRSGSSARSSTGSTGAS